MAVRDEFFLCHMIQYRWYYTLFFSMMASFLFLFDGFVCKIIFFFKRAAKRHPRLVYCWLWGWSFTAPTLGIIVSLCHLPKSTIFFEKRKKAAN